MNKTIVTFTGKPGAGKDTGINPLIEKYSIPTINLGHVCKNEMDRRGMKTAFEDNVRIFATGLRYVYGFDIMMHLSIPELNGKLDESDLVIYKDVKGNAEIDYLKKYCLENGYRLVTVAVIASADTRYNRSTCRYGEWDNKTMMSREAFNKRDLAENIWGLEAAIEGADIKITNEGEPEEFIESVENNLKELGVI